MEVIATINNNLINSSSCKQFRFRGDVTAQRPSEIMAMRWEDVDLEKGVWRQENTKNGSTNLVPLSYQVREILLARPTSNERSKGYL